MANDRAIDLVGILTYGKLVRINRVSWEVEPWLAETWTRSDDGLKYTLKLRPGVVFSDGHPFTADDVVFSVAAMYDKKSPSPIADSLTVAGKPLQVAAPDPRTVVFTFPSPFGPGVRILDNLFIVPRHKLGAALEAGTFGTAWGVTTPLSDIVGLGPFVLSEFVQGQRLVFTRNAHYWRKDASGATLPYLDRLTVNIVPDQDAETLRFQAGQSDVYTTELRTSDYAPVKQLADAGKAKLLDLGAGYDADFFWINLKPGAFKNDPRAAWIQRDELRRAISMAVDRQLILNTVFFGAGTPVFGPVPPANRKWYSPDVPHAAYDPARAKQLLASIGVGQGAHLTLITQKGHSDRERTSAIVRDELKKIGLAVDVVPLDFGEVMKRLITGNYEALYLGFGTTDTDPASNLDFWLSSGGGHFWNPDQPKPATDWERRIDELMAQQIAASDEPERQRIFVEVQKVFAEHEPLVYFVAPHVFVATSARVANAEPSLKAPQILWSADTLAVAR